MSEQMNAAQKALVDRMFAASKNSDVTFEMVLQAVRLEHIDHKFSIDNIRMIAKHINASLHAKRGES
jgi:hypothetical protein